MSSLRYYIGDLNGILHGLKTRLHDKLASPRDADAWIVFQDVLGSYGDLIKAAKQYYDKPVYVVQHGRAATLDYAPPNSFPLTADKFLCWGKSDYERMASLGYGSRTLMVGCPLNLNIKPRIEHKEKVVLFVPVNTGKEEPENIAAYYELLRHKYKKAQIQVIQHSSELKNQWGFDKKNNVKFNDLAKDFDVVAKLLPWHDANLYHGNTVYGHQHSYKNNELIFNLLRNVDLVVGIDEGTTEVFAYAHDVPVIVVDGFVYRQHKDGGRKFEEEDIYRTKAATHVKLSDLSEAIDYALAHPEHKRQERKEVAELEMGISLGNPNDNILNAIKNDFKTSNSLSIR